MFLQHLSTRIGLSLLIACGPDLKAPEITLQFAAETAVLPIPDSFGTEEFVQPASFPNGITALRCYGVIVESASPTLGWTFSLRNETSDELIVLLDNDSAPVTSSKIQLDVLYEPESDEGDGILDNVQGGDEVSCTLSAQDESNPVASESIALFVDD